WRVEAAGKSASFRGTRLANFQAEPLRFEMTDAALPSAAPRAERVLSIGGLPAGDYTLKIDGKEVMTASANEWAAGVSLTRGPELEQVEKLRAAIVEKNREFFHRWRPQNETYLFGFRKYEQGQNAREVPQFDPLVEKIEKEIAKLRMPAV